MATVKQILNVDLPKPVLSMAPGRGAPLPSDGSITRPSAGWRFDPGFNRYRKVGADQLRVHGKKQGVLVEPERTNFAEESANAKSWGGNTAMAKGSYRTSIFHELDGNGNQIHQSSEIGVDPTTSSTRSAYAKTLAGTTKTSFQAVESIFEVRDGGQVITGATDADAGNAAALTGVYFDISSESVGIEKQRNGTVEHFGWRKLMNSGPNGGAVYGVTAIIKFDAGGNNRTGSFAGGTDNDQFNIHHHTQVTNGVSTTKPIVNTGSGSTIRSDDDIDFAREKIYVDEWTVILQVDPIFHYDSPDGLIGVPGGDLQIGIDPNTYEHDAVFVHSGTNERIVNGGGPFQTGRVAISGKPGTTNIALNGASGSTGGQRGDRNSFGFGRCAGLLFERVDIYPEYKSRNDLEIITG